MNGQNLRAARTAAALFAALLSAFAGGCKHEGKTPALSKPAQPIPIPDVAVPPENGPKLGAVANVTPVFDRPATSGNQIGYLHAGARVARADKPFSVEGCAGGWFPIRPRGFVCVGQSATNDLNHPTLVAMAMQPKLDATLPYTYARVRETTPIYKPDPKHDDLVVEVGKLPSRSGFAVVGSWQAKDPEGAEQRLAMMTDGRFVRASDLEAEKGSDFHGVELGNDVKLPIAFVVKRGVRAWMLNGDKTEKRSLLDFHGQVPLTGRFRTISGVQFWEGQGGAWVRLKDVTLVRRRHEFPEFAKGTQKWIDISVVTGTFVLYEGSKAIFATLTSVGRDRLGEQGGTQSTKRGEFFVTAKEVTGATLDSKAFVESREELDVPWVLELSSGQLIHAAYWHDRFGVEEGPGHVQLSPSDAARVWQWADPTLPNGWHGFKPPVSDVKTIVNIRK